MTLDELKQLAEAAITDSAMDWFVAEGLAELLRLRDLSVIPDRDAAFIAAASPATMLKLLEMIAVLLEGLRRAEPIPGTRPAIALERYREIERSLGQ